MYNEIFPQTHATLTLLYKREGALLVKKFPYVGSILFLIKGSLSVCNRCLFLSYLLFLFMYVSGISVFCSVRVSCVIGVRA